MESNKIEHITRLLISDNNSCTEQLQAINISNYSQDAKTMLAGYFRDRQALNHDILDDLSKSENINTNH